MRKHKLDCTCCICKARRGERDYSLMKGYRVRPIVVVNIGLGSLG